VSADSVRCPSSPETVAGDRRWRRSDLIAVTLDEQAYNHTKKLIIAEEVALDDRDAWGEHRPTAAQENEFLQKHGFDEYGKWHREIDEQSANEKSDTVSRTATSRMSTAEKHFQQKCALDNTSIRTWKLLCDTCTECSIK
jgi:hypothetical protein